MSLLVFLIEYKWEITYRNVGDPQIAAKSYLIKNDEFMKAASQSPLKTLITCLFCYLFVHHVVCMWVHVYKCVHADGYLRLIADAFLAHCPAYSLRQSVSLNQKLAHSSCFCFASLALGLLSLSARLRGSCMPLSFQVVSEDLNSCLCVCAARASPTEPSLQTLYKSLKWSPKWVVNEVKTQSTE